MGQLQGRIAVVTGGGHGIGRTIAVALAREGASVAVLGRNLARLEETQTALRDAGGESLALACDIADKTAVRSAFGQIRAELGTVDILVNNAGITASRKFHETPDEVWEQIMQTNVNGMFYCCKAAVPDMINKRWGRIVTVASIAALTGLPFSSAYSASKHAQLGLTRTLALELARYNILVNAICPGWVETEMLEEAIGNLVKVTGRTAEQARADLLKLSGQTQAVTPEEVAAEALRLASPEQETTGQAVTLL
jgi:NAD(P)-dependent dehydrogenase (short-subunit alcohol dehydrogenase family)